LKIYSEHAEFLRLNNLSSYKFPDKYNCKPEEAQRAHVELDMSFEEFGQFELMKRLQRRSVKLGTVVLNSPYQNPGSRSKQRNVLEWQSQKTLVEELEYVVQIFQWPNQTNITLFF